jgi:hypothetical protein
MGPCSVRGAPLFCGANGVYALRGPELVREPALEAGLRPSPDGAAGTSSTVVDIAGRWPDDVWLVGQDDGARFVMRWTGAAWTGVALDPELAESEAGSLALFPWGRDGAMVYARGTEARLEAVGDASGAGLPQTSLRGCGTARLPSRLVPDGRGGAVGVLEYDSCGRPPGTDAAVEHWLGPGQVPAVLGFVPREVSVREVFPVTDGAVVFGEGPHGAPWTRSYDGIGAADLAVPSSAGTVESYARADGVEWLAGDSFWRRLAGGDWQRVRLPEGMSARAVSIRDGAVWVHAHGTCDGEPCDALLSTWTPVRTIEVDGPHEVDAPRPESVGKFWP